VKTRHVRLTLPALLLATASTLALAGPLKVKPAGGEGQKVIVCPHCKQPIAITQAGDYTIAFSGEEIHPKSGAARFYIRVTDASGKPATGAKVALTLSMPAHHHGPVKVPVTAQGDGQYVAVTTLSPHMRGQWKAAVQVGTPNGQPQTETFTFDQ
jgi:hypothetical protein